MRSTVISECGRYRYRLTRAIEHEPSQKALPCLFIMLNPSLADAVVDDPTIRRCLGFARSWGATELTVVNLFALRSPHPGDLWTHEAPIGPDNLAAVVEEVQAHRIGIVVAAWGADEIALKSPVREWLLTAKDIDRRLIKCLGVTKAGEPKHPLYIRGDRQLEPFFR